MSKEMAIALLRNPPRYFYVTRKGPDFVIMKDMSAHGSYGNHMQKVDEYEDYDKALSKCADMRAESLLDAVLHEVLYHIPDTIKRS